VTYIDTADLAEAASFRTRVKVAIVTAAANVVHEDPSGYSDPRAVKRNQLAVNILSDPESWTQRFVWPVVANPSIAANGLASSDGDLLFQVGAIFDAMAGVSPAEMASPQSE
jgi:hypothetical protein